MSRLTEYLFATFETPDDRIARLLGWPSTQAWIDAGGPPTRYSGAAAGSAPPASTATSSPPADSPVVTPGSNYSPSRSLAASGNANSAVPPANSDFGPNTPQPATAPPPTTDNTGDIPPPIDNQDSGASRKRTLLIDSLDAGIIGPDDFAKQMQSLGYDDQEIGLIQNLAASKASTGSSGPSISLGTLMDAFGKGTINQDELTQRLTTAGYKPEDVNLLTKYAADSNKQTVGPTDVFKAADAGVLTDAQVISRLMAQGYNNYDAETLLKTHKAGGSAAALPSGGQSSQQSGQTAQQKALSDSVNRSAQAAQKDKQQNISVINAGGGGPTDLHPQARQVLNDFKTSFLSNLKANQTGLSVPAQQWAQNNMGQFLQGYLGQPEGSPFTLGAQQIETLYQGQKESSYSQNRSAGQGAIQPRTIT